MSAAIVDARAASHRRPEVRLVRDSSDARRSIDASVEDCETNDARLSEEDLLRALSGRVNLVFHEMERARREIPTYPELRQIALDQLLDEPRFQHLRAHTMANQRRAGFAIVRTPA